MRKKTFLILATLLLLLIFFVSMWNAFTLGDLSFFDRIKCFLCFYFLFTLQSLGIIASLSLIGLGLTGIYSSLKD